MSIISIGDRITKSTDYFESFMKSDTSHVLVTSKHDVINEEFSLELSVGDYWADGLTGKKTEMYKIENDGYVLKPQTNVVIETREEIRMPNNLYGLIMPVGKTLFEYGILLPSSKIEPTYQGKLRLILYNSSSHKRTISKGMVVASAIFFRTEKTLSHTTPKSSYDVVPSLVPFRKKCKDFIKNNKEIVGWLVAIIITIINIIF